MPLFEGGCSVVLCMPPMLHQERLVLGLFRKSSNFSHLIQDTEPILLIVLYTLWPEFTIRSLKTPACIEMPDVDGIWKWWLSSDPDMPCWESEHWSLVLIAGLATVFHHVFTPKVAWVC